MKINILRWKGKNKTAHPEESCSIFLNGYTGVVRSKSIAPDEGWEGICASEILVIPAEIIGSEIQIGRIIRNTGMNGAVEFWQIQRNFAVFKAPGTVQVGIFRAVVGGRTICIQGQVIGCIAAVDSKKGVIGLGILRGLGKCFRKSF